jgi:outer membrane lipoprotein-sorting protein
MRQILKIAFLLLAITYSPLAFSQDMTALVQKVKAKLDAVNDYTAEGKMKTDITFIKAPVGNVKVYYKKPNKFKLKRDGGISILPKGGISINMGSIVTTNDFDVIYSGEEVVSGVKTKKVKLLPRSETSDVVLTTMYIDEANLLIKKAVTTTKENGTYEIEMTYGKYSSYGLPDKVVFTFNTKDYKMPKGITMDFEDEPKKTEAEKLKNKKGKVEMTYNSYTINKGVDDSVFK